VSGHTQGPWHVFSVYAQHEVRTPTDSLIAVVQSRDYARLIAAAPDMLAALREAVILLAGASVHAPELEPMEAYEAVSKAIAKATGSQPAGEGEK